LTYQISRDGQEFGPYSLSDVQRYVGTGNILLTDLARAEGTTEWIPVSQVVGTIAVAPPTVPGTYAPAANYPDAPNLHWGLVLLFGFLTCFLFLVVWDLIQVLWMKKVEPASKAFLYFMIFIGVYVLNFLFSFGRMAFLMNGHLSGGGANSGIFVVLSGISFLVSIGTLVMMILYRFTMKSSLEQHFNGPEPIGLSLGGIMTFFFGGLYFQYHLNRINEIKQAYRLSHPY